MYARSRKFRIAVTNTFAVRLFAENASATWYHPNHQRKLPSWGLAMFLKKHVFPILVVIFTLIAMLATYFAYSYRFTNPPQANFFDSIDYIAMGGLFLVIAKINLARNPQHQNLAIFTAAFAGIVFSNAAEKIMSLVWR
jgi:hypothetical protein